MADPPKTGHAPPKTANLAHTASSRGWNAYLILHKSYVREEMAGDVTDRLYIGEDTYNQTRRGVIRNVAKMLHDAEYGH
jgi:hypothetical protein